MPHPDHEKNRAAWNQMVEVHLHHPEYKTAEVAAGGSSLKRIELETMGDVRNKHLLHLMCQFGLDTLSWAREGAVVTGIDISDKSIERANELKRQTGLNAEFIRCDILNLIGRIDRRFDIVFQSYGTHCWISDITRWAQVVGHYLKPGGTFFMIDDHPFKAVFWESPRDYFRRDPDRETGAPDYCDRSFRIKGEIVEWQHPISGIVNALIGAGLVIEHLEEYNYSYYREEEGWYSDDGEYWYPPGGPARYPLMFSLKARKDA
ncbi:MAG TPA: class I SAM-dependent methyltransferase [Acidobacteriota bacterium]|nr:class I SAM-dependent methyltransferase [Acidobacteriota bacterium]